MKSIRNLFCILLFFVVSIAVWAKPEELCNLGEVPVVVIYIHEDQWNNLLRNFDTNPDSGQYVELDKVYIYDMDKGKQRGLRIFTCHGPTIDEVIRFNIKGNTGRIRPEVGPHKKSFGIYKQANFKVKFAKGDDLYGFREFDLKFFRADQNQCRDVYTYKLLRDTLAKEGCHTPDGVYTVSPYSSYAHLYIAIQGDNDQKNRFNPLDQTMVAESGYHAYDFGLYQLCEDISSNGFLDFRFGENAHKDKHGFLWKCGNMDNGKANMFVNPKGIGQYSLAWLKQQYDAAKSSGGKSKGSMFGISNAPYDKPQDNYFPGYDFKGDEENFGDAVDLLAGFIYNLNMLGADSSIADLRNWIADGKVPEGWQNPYSSAINKYSFDYKSFLNVIAMQQAAGGGDSYLHNSNNFALYFDKDIKKVYFIVHDLKLTFGLMVGPKPGQPGMGKQDIFNSSYCDAFGQQSLFCRLIKIDEMKSIYTHYLEQIAFKFKIEELGSKFMTIGTWYKLIASNFKQDKDRTNPSFRDYEAGHWVGEDGNTIFVQVSNDTTISGGEQDLKKIFDSSNAGWTWNKASGLKMFFKENILWNGYDWANANFVATSAQSILDQIRHSESY